MTFARRTILLGLSTAAMFSARSWAAGRMPFSDATFKAALATRKTVLLEVTAKWCGPCQRQRPVVAQLLAKPEFSTLQTFDADYDEHRTELLGLNARQLTTLILYRDGKEFARSSGDTTAEAVEAFFRKAL